MRFGHLFVRQHHVERRNSLFVLDGILDAAIVFCAQRRFEGKRHSVDANQLAELFGGQVHLEGEFLSGGLALKLSEQVNPHVSEPVHDLVRVNRNPYRARLIAERAFDRLPNPPRGLRGEFVAEPVVELVDGSHEPDVPFLNQVEEVEPTARVSIRYGHDQAEIGLHDLLTSIPTYRT